MTPSETNSRKMSYAFLQEIQRRAEALAERLDPRHKRNYEKDALLRALDAVSATSIRALNDPSLTKWEMP